MARVAKGGWIARIVRAVFAGIILPRAMSSPKRRARAFRILSQLGIRYRSSPIVEQGEPKLKHGPRAGDRFPDAPVIARGHATWLHRELGGFRFHLLLSGSGQLFQSLMDANLIDLYRFMVHPIVLGEGKRLFTDRTDQRTLRLASTETFSTGIVILEFEPADRA